MLTRFMLQNIAFALEMFSLQSDLHMQAYGAGHKLNMTYIEYSACILTCLTEFFSARES
jgi:hypothetical protein